MTFERRPLASTVNRIHRSGAGGGSMIRLGVVEHKGTPRYRAISAPICSVLVLGIMFPGASFAQDIAGKLIGRVQDSSGAVVAGARVTASDDDTSIDTTVATDSDVTYALNLRLRVPARRKIPDQCRLCRFS